MPAYIIVEVSIHDSNDYEEYKKLTPASLKVYEGEFVIRGGNAITLEGDWNPERIVVLKFPSKERAEAWWNSPEYAIAKSIRQRVAKTNMILLEGI